MTPRAAGRLLTGLLLGAAACSSASAPSPSAGRGARLPALHGSVPSGQVARPQFSLVDTSGHRYDFRDRTARHVTLLYAGYTHCPDECPTTMADIAAALRRLPTAVAHMVTVVFVTTDPWRDSRPVLRRWLDTFHPPTPFVGLRGTPAQTARVESALGMPAAKRQRAPASYGSGRYAVGHFDGLLAYGSNDHLVTIYPSDLTPGDLAADLRILVEDGQR